MAKRGENRASVTHGCRWPPSADLASELQGARPAPGANGGPFRGSTPGAFRDRIDMATPVSVATSPVCGLEGLAASRRAERGAAQGQDLLEIDRIPVEGHSALIRMPVATSKATWCQRSRHAAQSLGRRPRCMSCHLGCAVERRGSALRTRGP